MQHLATFNNLQQPSTTNVETCLSSKFQRGIAPVVNLKKAALIRSTVPDHVDFVALITGYHKCSHENIFRCSTSLKSQRRTSKFDQIQQEIHPNLTYSSDLAQAVKALECENSMIEVWVPSSMNPKYNILGIFIKFVTSST